MVETNYIFCMPLYSINIKKVTAIQLAGCLKSVSKLNKIVTTIAAVRVWKFVRVNWVMVVVQWLAVLAIKKKSLVPFLPPPNFFSIRPVNLKFCLVSVHSEKEGRGKKII